MRVKIVPKDIKNVSVNMNKLLEELNVELKKISENIDKISEVYQGRDSDIIVKKFRDRVNRMAYIVSNYENCKIYFSNISGAYGEQIDSVKKELDKIYNDANPELMNQNINNV